MATTYNILVRNGTLDVTQFAGPVGRGLRIQIDVPAAGYAVLDKEQVCALIAKLTELVSEPVSEPAPYPVRVVVEGPDEDGDWVGTAYVNDAMAGCYTRETYHDAHAKAASRALFDANLYDEWTRPDAEPER